MAASSSCEEEITLDLGGDFDKKLIILATDGRFGYPVLPHAADCSVLVFPDAEMDQVCKGVAAALQKYDDHTKIGVIIIAGSNNFTLENQFVGGKIPISYLVRNWIQVKKRITDSVIVPLRQLNQLSATHGVKLQVATVLPSPAMVEMKVPMYAELLRDSLKTVNTWIRQLNVTNHQLQLSLAEQYFSMHSSARRSEFLAVYKHRNFKSFWRTCMKSKNKLRDSL